MRPERRFERRNGRDGCDAATAPKHADSDPSEVNLLPAKFGLDNGVHFRVTSTLDAGIDRHANALEVMYSINVQIQEACSNMLQRFKPLLQSGIKQLSEGH